MTRRQKYLYVALIAASLVPASFVLLAMAIRGTLYVWEYMIKWNL
jgi:hypothetical protein